MRFLTVLTLCLFFCAQSLALSVGQACLGEMDHTGHHDMRSMPSMDGHHDMDDMAGHGDMPCCEDNDATSMDALCELTCAASACSSGVAIAAQSLDRLDWIGVAFTPPDLSVSVPSSLPGALYRPPIAV